MVRFGQTTTAADGKRSSLGIWPLLQNAQAMSIAITTVLPDPVAILQPIRVSDGRRGSNGASINWARSSSRKPGVEARALAAHTDFGEVYDGFDGLDLTEEQTPNQFRTIPVA